MLAKHPDLVQVTKTEDTPFEQFQEQKIKVVNDDWGTPLKTLRCGACTSLSLSTVKPCVKSEIPVKTNYFEIPRHYNTNIAGYC